MRRLIPSIIVASLFVSLILARAVDADDFPNDCQAKVVQSLVRLRTAHGQGTGFVVGYDDRGGVYVLTCYHVVNNLSPLEVVGDFYPFGSYDSLRTTELVQYSADPDVAMLRFTTSRIPPALHIAAPTDLPQGRFSVLSIGFPAGQLSTLCSNSDSALGGKYWILGDPIRGGASGSPLIAKTPDGYEVIGICCSSNATNAYAIRKLPTFAQRLAYDPVTFKSFLRNRLKSFHVQLWLPTFAVLTIATFIWLGINQQSKLLVVAVAIVTAFFIELVATAAAIATLIAFGREAFKLWRFVATSVESLTLAEMTGRS